MGMTSNFQHAISKALLSIANKVDPSGNYNIGKADYFDTMTSSIRRIADKFTPMPEVSSSDNGKVLSVVNGAWVAAEGGGGGALLVYVADTPLPATPQWILDVDPTFVAYETNVTYSQLHDALNSVVVGLSLPKGLVEPVRKQLFMCSYTDTGLVPGLDVYANAVLFADYTDSTQLTEHEGVFLANAENGPLYYCAYQYN